MRKNPIVLMCMVIALSLTCLSGCGTSKEADNRNEIVVISDLHLYVDDAYSRTDFNKQTVVDFLSMIRESKTVSEVVINGDLMDEWVVPMDYKITSLSDFDDAIVENNRDIINAINAIITDGNIKVTYIPGNHDMSFSEEEAERIFPGINQARDAEGLGTYTVMNGKVAIEHGHRYNFICAPDAISNRDITGSDTSILPCGYFLTRIAVSSALESVSESTNVIPVISQNTTNETQTGYYYYYMNLAAILSQLPLSESFSDDVIKTNFNGYTDTYSINDLLPYQDQNGIISVKLFNGIVESWAERQEQNNVNVPIDAATAIMYAGSNDFTDTLAQKEYFDCGSSARVVVFGHTHAAKIETSENSNGEKVIYANSGSWRDNSADYPLNTYIVITSTDDASGVSTIGLYQFMEDGTSELLQQEKLEN